MPRASPCRYEKKQPEQDKQHAAEVSNQIGQTYKSRVTVGQPPFFVLFIISELDPLTNQRRRVHEVSGMKCKGLFVHGLLAGSLRTVGGQSLVRLESNV